MKIHPTEISMAACARMTGALYLIIIVFGLFSEIFVRSTMIIYGDADATANNILASEWLFRAGFAGDLIIFLCDVAVAILLYVLLLPVSKTLSLLSAGFRLVGTAMYGVNLLNYFNALLILKGSAYLSSFDPGQIHSMALMFLNIHKHGYDLGLVFFGLHCLLLGYLLFKADYFPRILGVLMVLAGMGYVVGSFTLFLWPEYTSTVAPVYLAPLIGELSLGLWLLIKGVGNQKIPS
ncbi:MAG TPA: DUF4386 domain-containing protein [Syntrophales bacterium]|nr:DUF4386 domain-containing protein [Syntrophales bacterium]